MTEKEKEEKTPPEGSTLGEAEEGAAEVFPAPEEAEAPSEKMVEVAEKELEGLKKRAEERDEYLNLLLHTRADFSNYQKRMKREFESFVRYAAQDLVRSLIPAMDHLSRAIKSAEGTNSENLKKFLDGLQLIQNEFIKALEAAGVKNVTATQGQPFNPELHEAFLEEENAELPHHTILEELEPGFILHDRVLKPAKVKVSRRPTPSEEKAGPETPPGQEATPSK